MYHQKRIFLTIVFSLLSVFAIAQPQFGSIKGMVTNEDGKPLSDINIKLEGTMLGVASSRNGSFKLQNIPVEEYVLVVSGVGYNAQRKSITIEEGRELAITVRLSASNERLQDITVQSSKVNKFNTEETEFVARLPLENISNPQVYNTINSDLLEDQVVTNFDDALKNASGLFKLWESTGRGGDGAGYYSLRGFAVQPNMVNGLPSLTNGALDPVNIESIQVIKGPSGTLFGNSLTSYGGLINVVTKKPYHSFGGDISYKTGSFGLNRITADVNTPIGNTNNVALRVNGAYHNKNSFQDAGFTNSLFIAPSLSYRANDKLSFLINTEYLESESTNQTILFLNRSAPLQAANLEQLGYNEKHSYTSNDLTITNPTFSLQGQMKYEFSDVWASQTVISSSSAKTDGYYSYLWDIADGNGTFVRYLSNQNSTTLGTDIQQNFIGDFEIGEMRNRLVVGLDYLRKQVINNSTGYVGFGTISLQDEDAGGLSQSAADTALASASVNNSTTAQEVYSAYFSDVLDVTSSLSAMISLRVDHFRNEGNITTDADDYDQTALSPKLGIVYQPIKDKLSLFANYMNGFNNIAPRTQDDGSTKTFEPEQANQWETGVKANFFSGRLSATVSYYDILVSKVVREDPDRVNFYVQDGENYSRGFEANITASPVAGLNIIAGYSHNNSKITKTDNADYLNRRPESAGPEDLLNGWVSYRLSKGSLRGLGFGFGGNYFSENKILNRESTGVFTLPSYTILNGSVYYNTNDYRIDLKINNLTDKEYYTGWSTINPQQPRSITASFSYKF